MKKYRNPASNDGGGKLHHIDSKVPDTFGHLWPDFLRNNEKVIWWEVTDPSFATREVSEKTYYEIKSLVEQLISSRD